MQHSRSNNADTAFSFRISQTLHSASSLIERGQTGTKVGWITAVCKYQHTEIESKAQSLKDVFTRVGCEKTTHQLAFQPVALKFLGGPQPIGK